MNRNLRFRFVIYFFFTMLFSIAAATCVTYLIVNNNMDDTIQQNQRQVAESLIALDTDEKGLILDNGGIGSYEVYSVHRLDPGSDYIQKNGDRLDAGEIITEQNWLIPTISSTYFAAGKHYYQIALFPNSTVVWQIVTAFIAAIAATLILGTLVAALTGKRFVRPIQEMSRATEEVAKGNFSIRVSVPRNDEMGRLVNNFNRMTRDLGSTETLQREFVNNVSHEFKTPLASIKGFAELLQSESLTETQRKEYAEAIAEESGRLSKLTSSILRLAKLENTHTAPDIQTFSLDEQIRRVTVLLASEWSAKDLEMSVELEPVEIHANEELLREVWMNLLTNAIKFTPAGGQIAIRMSEGLDNIEIEVEDNGCGMSEEVRKRIFDKFYQGDDSHSSEGSGLGLALVKRIMEICGGSISVDSTEGQGSVFRVNLPRS